MTLLLMLCAGTAALAEEEPWPVDGKLLGENGKKSEDVSGIACVEASGYPRRCLVIDDELRAAQFVTLHDGRLVAGPAVQLLMSTLGEADRPLDGEGVAYSEGHFYVIGSHGHPRDPKRRLDPEDETDQAEIEAAIAASSWVVRLAEDGDPGSVTATANLRPLLLALPALQPHADRRLDENGLTIEGLAVVGDRLLAGLRGPLLPDGAAAVVAVGLQALFAGTEQQARLFRLPLGGRGVRDLAPHGAGFLVLSGPAGDGEEAGAIHAWDGESDAATLLAELPRRYGRDGALLKAEALLPLDETPDGLRLLLLHDGGKEGEPSTLVVPLP